MTSRKSTRIYTPFLDIAEDSPKTTKEQKIDTIFIPCNGIVGWSREGCVSLPR